ncbi:MAG: DNA polymerase III subunit delta [Phycisphaerae bacterium]
MSKQATSTDRKPIYVVSGKDRFLRIEKLDALLDSLLGKARDGLGLVMLEGAAAEPADVFDELRTPALLAPLRVVCITEADAFLTPPKQAKSEQRAGPRGKKAATRRELVERYLASPSPTGILVLECQSWPSNTRLYRVVEEIGRHIDTSLPGKGHVLSGHLASWSANRARTVYGCKLSAADARHLVALVGDDAGMLNMELAKLATFIAPRTEIRAADIDALVGHSRQEMVFRVTEAIAKRRPGQALALWRQVLASDRDASYRAVGGLAHGFRELAEVKRAGPQASWVGTKILPQSERFSLARWHEILVRLLRIDLGSKSGGGTVEVSVEKLIVELCAAS